MSLLLLNNGQTCCVIIILAVLQCRAEISSKSFDACQTDSFNVARYLFNGRRLRSRSSQSEPINVSSECHMKCVKNCRCLSYNVCNGSKLCELNPEKKEKNISLYETSDVCDYYELSFNQKVGKIIHGFFSIWTVDMALPIVTYYIATLVTVATEFGMVKAIKLVFS